MDYIQTKAADELEDPEIPPITQADNTTIHVDDDSRSEAERASSEVPLPQVQLNQSSQELSEYGHQQENLPEVTISAVEEDSKSSITVPLQRSWTGRKPVISTSLADTPCTDLGVAGFLKKLNSLMRTSYSLEENTIPGISFSVEAGANTTTANPSLSNLLDSFLHPSQDRHIPDFGTAYAFLRPWWHLTAAEIHKSLSQCRDADTAMRDTAQSRSSHFTGLRVDDLNTPPRRVWDLFANRVIPAWVAMEVGLPGLVHPNGSNPTRIAGVSHSWMNPGLRRDIKTPINGYGWPVPIPVDATLAGLRIELLNLGLEYVWLDVLCLRQAGADMAGEMLRKEEWRLDIPTIGNVYWKTTVVHYYSGLGRPFVIGDLSSERHWLNRAWTLQEISPKSILAGVTPESPFKTADDIKNISSVVAEEDGVRRFSDKLAVLEEFSKEVTQIFPLLEVMRCRASTTELDKIAGLAYLIRAQMMFLYPKPGNGKHKWVPSWEQIRSTDVLPSCQEDVTFDNEEVVYVRKYGVYFLKGYWLDPCIVKGLQDPRLASNSPRTGTILVTDKGGRQHEFPVLANHEHPIPVDEYILFGSRDLRYWVITKMWNIEYLQKVSVLRIEEGGNTIQRLRNLDTAFWYDTGFN